MKHMLVAVGVLGFVCAATVGAQAQEAKPGADLKKLDVWNGEWTWEEQVKESSSGEAKTIKGTGEQRRMGDHFYVWNSKGKNANGEEMSFVGVTGYDPVTKAYSGHGFSSDGWRGTSTVTFGDTTISTEWTGVTATGEKTRRRCTDEPTEAGSTWTCEDFTDGKWWVSIKGKGSIAK